MIDLASPVQRLSPSPSRYGAGKTRSPAAMAAALALNGGVIALLLALPATQYLIQSERPTGTILIPLDPPPPPPNDPEVKPKDPVRKPTTETVTRVDPDPVLKLPAPDDSQFVRGAGESLIGDGGAGAIIADPVIVPPVHVPVLVSARPDPRYAAAFQPDYPPALRRLGIQGKVTIRLTVDERGRVVAVELVRADHPEFFEEARATALRSWRYKPATRDGVPVPTVLTQTIEYRLVD